MFWILGLCVLVATLETSCLFIFTSWWICHSVSTPKMETIMWEMIQEIIIMKNELSNWQMFKNLNRILSRKSLPSQNYSAKILLSELDVMLIELILHIFFFCHPWFSYFHSIILKSWHMILANYILTKILAVSINTGDFFFMEIE